MSGVGIMITSAGRRVSLLRAFRTALESLKLSGSLVAVDVQANAPALHVADQARLIKPVKDPGYVEEVFGLCIEMNVKIIVPTIDTELELLASHEKKFRDIGVTVLTSGVETNRICIDKRRTYEFFAANKVPMPRVYSELDTIDLAGDDFPLLIKPARGSSSVSVTILKNRNELDFFCEYVREPIIMECVRGQEYTMDVLVDRDAAVRCVVPRARLETRAGEVSKAVTVRDGELIEATRAVVEALPDPRGCLTVQCFRRLDGGLAFIEINPRFGGGVPLSIASGANYPRWILQMALGLPEDEAMQDRWEDGLGMLRYDEDIFVRDMMAMRR